MARDDEKIAPTAHYTAYVWHRLRMPHAELFATPLGAGLFNGFCALGEGLATLHPTVPSMTQYLELRHRGIEAALERMDPDVVVELGAGLSRRGVTFAGRGLRYFEVDLPEMVALKGRLIDRGGASIREAIRGRLTLVAADALGEGFEALLRQLVGDASRPLVIAEGLLGYFAMASRAQLARDVARALDGRGAFLAELRHGARGSAGAALRMLEAGIALATRGRGTREDFAGLDAVERFLLHAGFAHAEPLPPVAHLAHLEVPTRVWRASGAGP